MAKRMHDYLSIAALVAATALFIGLHSWAFVH